MVADFAARGYDRVVAQVGCGAGTTVVTVVTVVAGGGGGTSEELGLGAAAGGSSELCWIADDSTDEMTGVGNSVGLLLVLNFNAAATTIPTMIAAAAPVRPSSNPRRVYQCTNVGAATS